MPPDRHANYTVLRNESLDGINVVNDHLLWQIKRITQQKTWSAVRKLYRWICKRVADFLEDRRSKIQSSIINDCSECNGRLTQDDLDKIQSCTSVDDIMEIIGISKQWLDVGYLEAFFHDMADPLAPGVRRAKLLLDNYKQLLQYLCCKVLLREAPDSLLQELLKGAETRLQSSNLLVVIHELDYKCFNVAQLLKEKECLEKLLDIPPGHLNCHRVEDGHSVAIYWLIDKRHITKVMLDIRWIFWPLVEHQVTSLELVGSLTLSLKGGHVPYLIRDALLTRQDLIQQTEVSKLIYLPCSPYTVGCLLFNAMSWCVFGGGVELVL